MDARRFQVVPVEAAGHLAVVISRRPSPDAPFERSGVHLIEVDGERISHVVSSLDQALAKRFLSAT